MLEAVQRPNIVYCETLGPEQFGIVEKPLTLAERIYNKLAAQGRRSSSCSRSAWEIYGRWLDNPLLVPTFSDDRARAGRRCRQRHDSRTAR